jgi:predicted DNA-binding transcriptional regulator AlpA
VPANRPEVNPNPPETVTPPDGSFSPLVYDTRDLCRVLRCSLATLHRLKAAGKLPRSMRLGGELRWDAEEVRAWVAARMPDLARWEAIKAANG